jgi:Histidine kinase-like ATPase domain
MSDDHAVELSIPADPMFFHVARSVVTAVAAQLDLPLDEVDDVRLAVAECCNMLGGPPGPRRLRVRADVQGGALTIEVSAEGASTSREAAPVDTLSWSIVAALADDVRWETDGGAPSVITRWQLLGAVPP